MNSLNKEKKNIWKQKKVEVTSLVTSTLNLTTEEEIKIWILEKDKNFIKEFYE